MEQQELLTNDPQQRKYVFSKLSYLLKKDNIVEVTIMVAFITIDGVYLILNELKDLLDKEVRVVIITGFMNNFNHPRVFDLLLQIDNLEVRIANVSGYHPKLYLIKDSNNHAFYIIGSSNLTNSALRRNLEANVYLENTGSSEFAHQVYGLYQQVYAESRILTASLLAEYRIVFCRSQSKTTLQVPATVVNLPYPNTMQEKALIALSGLRKENQTKALIISATGSGKTYLSAFDVRVFKPRRLLFIAHRESILNAAISSYCMVIPGLVPGKLTGGLKEVNHNFIFASIQTLQKDEYLYQFKSDWFDYIIIDEVHRAGAVSYQKVLTHFRPQFLLGMTATPDRSDNFDIYHLFDHNIAYEIRLSEALEENLVCPFHYFGVSELIINNTCLDDYSDFNKINFDLRVDYILAKLRLYGHGGNKVRGLVFTSRIEEAQRLSLLFNQRGYRSLCLSGATSDDEREQAIKLLANDYQDEGGQVQEYLDYIFSVDIFNEGIDIPSVNQIILLRPTQSSIIFIQQIGRGLRKSADKEYCVILDFIGNYNSNFLIAAALSGNSSYDRESLRCFVSEANSIIPANATVSFDRVTRQQLYASISAIQINRKFINHEYLALKKKLNRVPKLIDFRTYNAIDPKVIFKYSGKTTKSLYANYYELLEINNDINMILSLEQSSYLTYITQELLFAARPDEMYVLLSLMNNFSDEELIYVGLMQQYNTLVNEQKQSAIKKILTLETSAALSKKYLNPLVAVDEAKLKLERKFASNLQDSNFKALVIQTLELGLAYFTDYAAAEKFNDFILYYKYSRKEVVRLLNLNLSFETAIYGYRIIGNTIPIFITYTKLSEFKINAKYNNVFLNPQEITWYSRSFKHIDSPEIQQLINYRENNLVIMLFLKKSDNEGSDYYYLGNADIADYHQEAQGNSQVLKCTLRLEDPLVDSYFDYFVN